MKKLIYLIALIPFAFGCGNGNKEGVLSAEVGEEKLWFFCRA